MKKMNIFIYTLISVSSKIKPIKFAFLLILLYYYGINHSDDY